MKRTGWLRIGVGSVCPVLLIFLSSCGGGNSPVVRVPPPPNYTLAAGTLTANPIAAGSSSTATVTVTPFNGYTGTVTLSCSSVSGGSMPAPMCSFNPSSVNIQSASAAQATLTLSTTSGTPSAAYTVNVTGKDAAGNPPANGTTQSLALTVQFQHIVIIVQENRTPDNLFQDQNLIAAGADISSSANNAGTTIQLAPTTLGIDYDLSHKHDAFTAMCDLQSSGTCLMDGAAGIEITCSKGATDCPPANPQFLYVQNVPNTDSDIQPYFDMAEQYTFGDHMFQTNEGPSFPAHQFLLAGTSAPCFPASSTCTMSDLLVAENPLGISNSSADTGCTSPSAEYVATIDPTGTESATGIYPCFEHITLTDELEAAGVSWRYYAPLAGSIWTAPNAIQHMCGPPESVSCTQPDWANVSLNTQSNMAPILTDIAAGQLQQVSWVIPTGSNSDHAGDTTTTGGPSWVASIVNAIGNSSYWPNTAIIVIWDDWGGWYDHVPPPKVITDGTSWGSGYVYGFRVPLIVISPLAKPAHISSTPHDFGSILKFVENTFGLPSLGFADANALDDLSDCFNFSQTPNVFKTINAPLKADFFLHDKRPPTPPDND